MSNNGLWHLKQGFILASASPQRRALLKEIQLEPEEIVSPDVNEDLLKGELPRQYVERVAVDKAKAVALMRPHKCVLAADTVLAVGRRIIRKAKTIDEARKNLNLISGRKHRVYTGVAVVAPDGRVISRVNVTSVVMKHLDEDDIRVILDSNEWQGVAGYKIEGVLASFVKQISGSYSGIVGLPVYETTQILRGILR